MNRIFSFPAGFILRLIALLFNAERHLEMVVTPEKSSDVSAGQTRKITGQLVGLKPGQIVYLQSAQRVMLDSVRAEANGFAIKRELTEPNLYHVLVGKENLEFQFVWDTDIVISGLLKKPAGISITGSPLTDEWNAYQRDFMSPLRDQLILLSQDIATLRSKNDTSGRYKTLILQRDSVFQTSFVHAKNYIQKHSDSFVSLYTLSSGWDEIGSPALLASLSEGLQGHSIALELKKAMNDQTAQVGSIMPDFDLKTLTDQRFTGKELEGRYTLIDFWGTWCGPCLRLTPELVRIHDIFRSDSVQFVGFVCEKNDINPTAIQQFARKRGMTWQQVPVDLRNTTAVDKTWEILSFPTFIVVGPDRRVLARGDGENGLNECINVLSKHRKP